LRKDERQEKKREKREKGKELFKYGEIFPYPHPPKFCSGVRCPDCFHEIEIKPVWSRISPRINIAPEKVIVEK
jgi:hypothetical protein